MADATLSRDVALNVIGKIEGYQKELEKLPGVTQKAATKAALAMQKTFTNDLVKQFKEADKEAARSAGNWREIFSSVASNISTDLIKSFASAAANMKSEIAELTGEIATYSRATGLSLESVNALRFAMESQGRTFDELGSALENFPERMEQFRQGGGEAAGVMEILGFKTKDADKLIADMGGTFEEVIKRIQGMENEGHRAALMTSMFGDSALYLGTALGDVPLEEWKDRAKVGVDVSREAVAANQDWANTVGVLSEAFKRLQQDATSIIDLNAMAKDAGQVFVAFGATATAMIDGTLQHFSALVTAVRMAARGDFKSAGEAWAEFTQHGITGVAMLKDAIKQGKDAGREFRSVADALNNVEGESEGAATGLGKTTQQMKDAKNEAKQLAAELDKQRKAQFDWYKTYRDVTSDQTSEEVKLLQAHRDRQREAFLLVKEQTISRGEYANYVKLSEERLGRDIASLHEEQAKEARQFAEETKELVKQNDEEILELKKEHFSALTDLAFEYANTASAAVGGIFDLMADRRAEDLAGERKFRDKLKNYLDDLYDKRKETTDKAELNIIESNIRITRSNIDAATAGVKSAKEAAREVAVMQKAQSMFQIGLNTAQAVMLAWATVPPPLTVAAVIAAGAAGATQLAVAGAQPLPKFFGGTARIPGSSPGEMGGNLHQGESVLNARATADLGPQIIDALNAGLSPLAGKGGGVVQINIDGKKVAEAIVPHMWVLPYGGRPQVRQGSSPIGYRSPYGRN